MIDQTDMEILKLLMANSRMQRQEIGEIVHLTGQAVKNRISRLEKLGIIEGYTVRLNESRMGMEITAYVTVFMKTTDHAAFRKYLEESVLVTEAHRISGEGCYLMRTVASSQQELIGFLDSILRFGNYKVNLSISRIK